MKKHITHVVLVGSMLAFFAATPAFAAIDDATHFWGFDEGTGRSIGDTGGQNGVMTGSSTGFGWASGKVGTALAMDGEAGLGVVLPNGTLSGTQGSLSVWIDALELSENNIIFSARSIANDDIYMALAVDRDGRPVVLRGDPDLDSELKAQGSRLIGKNEWVNVVLTANTQTYKMFVNGEEATVAGDNNGRWFSDFTTHTLKYRIGVLDETSGSFSGYVDDLRIFDRVLTPEEVMALYEKGNTAKSGNPLAAGKISMSVSSDHIPQGGSVAVTWNAEYLDTCTASGDWSGPVATSGTQVFVKLAYDATYKLSCAGKYATVDGSVHVVVAPAGTTTTTTITTPGTTQTTPVSTATSAARKAQIDKLIAQIMQLIVELQKQLAALKAAGAR